MKFLSVPTEVVGTIERSRDLRLGFFRVAAGRRWHDDEDDEDEDSRMRKMIINDKHCGGDGDGEEEDYRDNGEDHNDGDTNDCV